MGWRSRDLLAACPLEGLVSMMVNGKSAQQRTNAIPGNMADETYTT